METRTKPADRYAERMAKIREYFGSKTIVSRQELLAFVDETGIRIPAKLWASRVGRGMIDLNYAPSTTGSTSQVKILAEEVVVDARASFVVEAQIPKKRDTFVEWGHYKDIKQLISSNEFFTLYITGESGSGKNEMVDQACAALNRPIVRVNMTADTKEDQLLGTKTLVDGNIVWEDGPVTWCAQNGAILLIDEISLSDANAIMAIQNVLEGKPFFVKGANKLVTPVPGFAVICTDNTKGRGSDSGRYIGTNVLNDAFLERFEMMMIQSYPPAATERKIISKLMSQYGMVDEAFLNRLVTWVHAIRKTYNDEGIEEHITTRRACHIVNTYRKMGDAEKAINLCINRFDETSVQAMLSLWSKVTA